MNDSISRKTAIDTLRKWDAVPDYNEAEHHIMRAAMAMLEDMPSAEPQWIPVEERLPNDEDYHNFAQFPDGAVLWCTDKGIVGAGWYYESTKSWSCLDDTFPERYGNVIAWMPLPESYQETEHGQH